MSTKWTQAGRAHMKLLTGASQENKMRRSWQNRQTSAHKLKMLFSRCTRSRRSEDSPDKPSGRSQLRTTGGAPGHCLALARPAVVLGGDKCTKHKFFSPRRSHKCACPAAALKSKRMKGAACCSLKLSMPKLCMPSCFKHALKRPEPEQISKVRRELAGCP